MLDLRDLREEESGARGTREDAGSGEERLEIRVSRLSMMIEPAGLTFELKSRVVDEDCGEASATTMRRPEPTSPNGGGNDTGG